MKGGRLTVWINGREALPVRAIPYVTGWLADFAPDGLACHLARWGQEASWFLELPAYHFPDCSPVQPREWDAVIAALDGYKAELQQQAPDEAIGYALWRKHSVSKLPVGVFVWLDKFELVIKAKITGDMFGEKPKRPGDGELILSPMLDELTRKMVLEGFGSSTLRAQIDASPAENGSGGNAPIAGRDGTAAPEEPKTKNWILLVQAEAARRWKSLRSAGANPTKNNLKGDLATWCRETNVLTDGDINPSAEYIYRHVLNKWTPPKC